LMQIKFLVETQHIVQVCGGLPHVVSDGTANVFSRLGIGIVGGCDAYGGMLAFIWAVSGHPGLGLKLGFRRRDRMDFIVGEG
jgi:hypothetical protein